MNTRVSTQINPNFAIGQPPACVRVAAILLLVFSTVGCRVQAPSGTPVSVEPLGSVLDQANEIQERNAEAAKLVVYAHEFEINQPIRASDSEAVEAGHGHRFEYEFEDFIRGFRLTPYGQDHIRQIAKVVSGRSLFAQVPASSGVASLPNHKVIIERSESSRKWKTNYRYPVHFNAQLDDLRRRIVVDALLELGVPNAEDLVVIGPAFAEGLNATEAARAYVRSLQSTGGGASTGAASQTGSRF